MSSIRPDLHDAAVQRLQQVFGDKWLDSDGNLHEAQSTQDNAAAYDEQIKAAEAVGDRQAAGRLKIMKSQLTPLPEPPQPEDGSPAAVIADQYAVQERFQWLLIGTDDADELKRRVAALAEIDLASKNPISKDRGYQATRNLGRS